jgi:hypothetical protein
MYTKHLPERKVGDEDMSPTWAGVTPTDLTDQEKEEVKKGTLGYCENHKVLYKKWALHRCIVPAIFPDMGDCKEWPMDPDYTEIP